MDYFIRLAEDKDCRILAYLKKDIWETTYREIYPDVKFNAYDYNKEEDKFRNIVNNSEVDLYVVIVNDEIVGYMSFGKPLRPFRDYEQDISLFYLKKDIQHKGIGRDLFSLAYESIKFKGYNKFFISCNKYNVDARLFYEKMGGIIVFEDEDNEDKSLPQVKFNFDIRRNEL